MTADTLARPAADGAAPASRIGRLVREGRSGFAVCAIDPPAGVPAAPSTWVVVDVHGRIVEFAKSELIAVAKMQALALSALSASIARPRASRCGRTRRRMSL